MLSLPSNELLNNLKDRIRLLEDHRMTADRSPIRVDIGAVEDWLPEEGLPAGSLLEFLSAADGTGALTLALFMARHACHERKVVVVVDQQGSFYAGGRTARD